MNPNDQPEPNLRDVPETGELREILREVATAGFSTDTRHIRDDAETKIISLLRPVVGDEELREEEIEHILASAFQDGFGAARDPKYRNRTVEHTKRIMSLVQAHTEAAVHSALVKEHRELSGVVRRAAQAKPEIALAAIATAIQDFQEKRTAVLESQARLTKGGK